MGNRLQRMREAFSKAFFCARHTADVVNFLRLVRETKKWKGSMHDTSASMSNDQPIAYRMRLLEQEVGLQLRTFHGDLAIFYEVFWREVYPKKLLRLAHAQTIIDLGGHVGMSVLYFALSAPAATVYVLEPDKANFDLLEENTSVLDNRVIPIHAAAASEKGTAHLQQTRYAYNSRLTAESNGQVVNLVSVTDLMQHYKLQKIDLIKIDIEGAEEEVFSRNTVWLNITNQVIVEIHSISAFASFKTAVTSAGFTVCCLSGVFGEAGIYHAMKKES